MKKGFTLVELVIVIVIVGILSIIAVPIYKGYVEKAQMTEGKAFVSAIISAQKIYHLEHGEYMLMTTYEPFSKELDIDARGNKYFKTFITTLDGLLLLADALTDDNSLKVGMHWSTNSVAGLGGHRTPYYYIQRDGGAYTTSNT